MAGIIYNKNGASVNPPSTLVPVNTAGAFTDSYLYSASQRLQSQDTANSDYFGVSVNFATNDAILGDYSNQGNGYGIEVSDSSLVINFTGSAISSGSASGSSGQHLCISVNGTPYKIALLNP